MSELPEEIAELYLTDPIGDLGSVDAVLCSGGVAEYVYGRESRDFGDLGKKLGGALRARLDSGDLPWALLTDSHGIRSTALGCSEFTAQLSGNTSFFSDPERLLPRRNLKVLRPAFEFADTFDAAALTAAIRRHMVSFEIGELDPRLVLAFHWEGLPRYSRLEAFARGVVNALPERLSRGHPLYVILDADIAMTFGAILHAQAGGRSSIAVIDGLKLWDFDAIDIGRLREPSLTVPVTIKSLVFSDVAGGVRRRELVHHTPGIAVSSSL